MARYIEGEDRNQSTLFPEALDDYVGEDSPARVIDVFVDDLDLSGLGFERCSPALTVDLAIIQPCYLNYISMPISIAFILLAELKSKPNAMLK